MIFHIIIFLCRQTLFWLPALYQKMPSERRISFQTAF
uniref:Uncharacterized protein n=1 Tax=Neisseria meningitidis alpha522 TaxID=996307 RepID=I4E780_NEIME|nr:hypothetical protein NMALPHA522_1657 [Neisseria meningitidis alpha522]